MVGTHKDTTFAIATSIHSSFSPNLSLFHSSLNKSKTTLPNCRFNRFIEVFDLKNNNKMGSSENQQTPDEEFNNTFHHSSASSSSNHGWKNRIFIPTLLAGVAGAGTGLISKHRRSLGLANVSASYAANFAIITGCYCGAREFVVATRKTGPEDLLSSAVAGFGSGALLGRFYGGQFGAVRYSVIFAIVGTTADYSILKLKDVWRDYSKTIYQDIENLKKNENWLRLPEWFPIKVLNEEELAVKRAQEEKFLAQRARIRSLKDEDP